MPDLLTTDEAATYLRLSERKLYELVANGAVPCTKVTGKWLFPKAALDRWLAAGLLTPALAHAPAPPIMGGSHDPLLEWAQRESGSGLAAGARTLAEALGNLPLALDHAAAYCKRTQMQFGDYTKKASSLIAAAPRGAGYPRSVAATFNLAIAGAVAQCQSAEALMAYLAQCAPERIPMALVEGPVEDEAERMEALAALAEVSLVRHDPFEDGTPA